MSSNHVTKPSRWEMGAVSRILAPWRAFVRPVIFGGENIPADRPLLFIGNHSLFAFFDSMFMFEELYFRHDIYLHALGDRAHFQVPVWREIMAHFGVLEGTHEHAARLLGAGECVLIFPGGAREAFKQRGEANQVIWKDRVGFARFAIRYGCSIIPFSAVGADELYRVVIDSPAIMKTPIGKAIAALGIRPDAVLPIVRGVGPTLIPRRERVYIRLGKPIATARYGGRFDDLDAARELRDTVRDEVRRGIDAMLRYRETDPERHRWPRLGEIFDNERRPDLIA